MSKQRGHTMRVTFIAGTVFLNPDCHEPNDAICHLVCPKGCEEWGPDHEHKLEPSKFCNAVEFLTNGDCIEEMCDEHAGFSLYDGMPVEVRWDGDAYFWSPVRKGAQT